MVETHHVPELVHEDDPAAEPVPEAGLEVLPGVHRDDAAHVGASLVALAAVRHPERDRPLRVGEVDEALVRHPVDQQRVVPGLGRAAAAERPSHLHVDGPGRDAPVDEPDVGRLRHAADRLPHIPQGAGRRVLQVHLVGDRAARVPPVRAVRRAAEERELAAVAHHRARVPYDRRQRRERRAGAEGHHGDTGRDHHPRRPSAAARHGPEIRPGRHADASCGGRPRRGRRREPRSHVHGRILGQPGRTRAS